MEIARFPPPPQKYETLILFRTLIKTFTYKQIFRIIQNFEI